MYDDLSHDFFTTASSASLVLPFQKLRFAILYVWVERFVCNFIFTKAFRRSGMMSGRKPLSALLLERYNAKPCTPTVEAA